MAYQGKHALSVSAQLKLDIKEFAANLSRASKQMSTFAKGSMKPIQSVDKKLHVIGLGLRDIARIASGIMISQAFYRGAQAIGDATNALSEFNESLDYAQVTYTALFGSSDISTRFLETLKEQAIDTMYSFEDLTQASKKLLAYGIDYKNVAYITEGLGNLAAMSGDTAAMDRISYALGQIYAKGTLKAEEMRQLANAYVPIQQILRESFNLSDDQLGRVGDLRLPAEQVINAIVDYANTKFASVGDAAMLTLTGLKSRIADNFKVTGSEITKPLVNIFKSFLAWFDGQLTNIRKAYSAGGAGGIFEYLVPDEGTRQLIRQFLAAVHNMILSTIRVLASMAPIVRAAFSSFIMAYNAIAPIATVVNNLLAIFISAIANSSVAMNILKGTIIAASVGLTIFAAKLAITKLIAIVTKGIKLLSAALAALSVMLTKVSVTGLLLGGVVVALIALIAFSNKGREAIAKLADKFQGLMNGLKSDNILQVKDGMDQTTASSEEFNNALDSSGDALDELTDKAAKAKKGLLSFDEVFKLNSTNDETSGVDYDSIYENLNIPTTDSFLPEIGSFSDYTDAFAKQLFSDLWNSVKDIAAGATSGLLVGSLVGFVIGGLITKTLAGALAGAKWGSTIGAVAGGGFALFWKDMSDEMQRAIKSAFVGAATGAFAGGLAGFVIGAAVTRTLAGALTGAKLGATIGTLAGGTIGAILGDTEDVLKNKLSDMFKNVRAASYTIVGGGLVGLVIGAIVGATAGTGIGALPGAKAGAAIGAAVGGIQAFLVKAITGIDLNKLIDIWVSGLASGESFGDMFAAHLGHIKSSKYYKWLMDVRDETQIWFNDLKQDIDKGWTDAWSSIKTSATNGWTSVSTWFTDLKTNISDWFTGLKTDVHTWWTDAWTAIKSIDSDTFYQGGLKLGTTIRDWFVELKADIHSWWDDAWTTLTDGWTLVSTWFVNLKIGMQVWFTNLIPNIKTWWSNLWTNLVGGWVLVSKWFSDLKTDISTWFTNLKSSVKSFWTNAWTGLASGWSIISSWFSSLKNGIGSWFTGLKDSIKAWWKGLFDGLSIDIGFGGSKSKVTLGGHATGGVFNREHIARFAEGNKAEAVIPLQNDTAMQPFVDAVSNGLLSSLMPALATSGGGGSDLPPVYVGTLIADDKGLKELERKLKVIRVKEEKRGN